MGVLLKGDETMKLINEDEAKVYFICWSDKEPELLLKVAKKLGLDNEPSHLL